MEKYKITFAILWEYSAISLAQGFVTRRSKKEGEVMVKKR